MEERTTTSSNNDGDVLRRLWEQAIADENYNLANTYSDESLNNQSGVLSNTGWSDPVLYNHGVPVVEIQQMWDDALEDFHRALEENANAETIRTLDDRLTTLVRNHVEVVFPEADVKL